MAQVLDKLDSNIHRINHDPVDKYEEQLALMNCSAPLLFDPMCHYVLSNHKGFIFILTLWLLPQKPVNTRNIIGMLICSDGLPAYPDLCCGLSLHIKEHTLLGNTLTLLFYGHFFGCPIPRPYIFF